MVGGCDLVGDLAAGVDVLVKVVFPFVLLGEREFYLLLFQLCRELREGQLVEGMQRCRYLHSLEVLRQPTVETVALLLQLGVESEHGIGESRYRSLFIL